MLLEYTLWSILYPLIERLVCILQISLKNCFNRHKGEATIMCDQLNNGLLWGVFAYYYSRLCNYGAQNVQYEHMPWCSSGPKSLGHPQM